MSGTAVLEPCPTCGTPVAPDAKFCQECGRRVDVRIDDDPPPDLPLDDPRDPVPVATHAAEPQYFGLGPPLFVFSVAVVLFVAAVLVIALGSFVVGLALLVISFLLLPTFLAGARRWPDSGLSRVSLTTAQRARGEASVAAQALSTWSRAGREAVRLRKEQFGLRRALDDKLYELGRSVLEEDGQAPLLTTQARALAERLWANEEALQRTVDHARRHVREERAAVVSTEVLRPEDEPSGPLAGERPEDERQPVHADHVGLDTEREDGGERGAEPGGGAEGAPQEGEAPGDEREQPQQA